MLLTSSSWAGFAPGLQTRALARGWEADHGPEAGLPRRASQPTQGIPNGLACPPTAPGLAQRCHHGGTLGRLANTGGQRDSPLCLGQRREMGFLKGPLAYPGELYPRTGAPAPAK